MLLLKGCASQPVRGSRAPGCHRPRWGNAAMDMNKEVLCRCNCPVMASNLEIGGGSPANSSVVIFGGSLGNMEERPDMHWWQTIHSLSTSTETSRYVSQDFRILSWPSRAAIPLYFCTSNYQIVSLLPLSMTYIQSAGPSAVQVP